MEPSVFLIDKVEGATSHDHVAAIRRELGKGIKVGHAGTLDPFATGLLIVLAGRATRTQSLFMGLGKTYETTARFGAVSNTGDRDGEIVETGVVPEGDLSLPTGRIIQTPPAFSALKVGGRRAYDLARAGEEVELEPREVRVEEFTEVWRRGRERRFRIRCSSGTYVRSLVSELGDAHCVELRRTAIGPFHVDESAEGHPIPLVDALRRILPELELGADEAASIGHGRPVTMSEESALDRPVPRMLATHEGRLVAVVELNADGVVRSLIGLPSD